MSNYNIISLKENYKLFERIDKISDEIWPEFMCQDPIAKKYWMTFIKTFKEYQIAIMENNEILAFFNSVPLYFDKPIEDLPDKGWDWGLEKSIKDFESGIKPNFLMGIQIVVNKEHQGKGLSSIAVKEMAKLAKRQGFNNLIIPVRPSDKHKYPLIPMEKYIKWENEAGMPFDNWLRVHIRAGGRIVKVCPEAMYIPGTIEQWTSWTDITFPGSGKYIIPFALNPVNIDKEKDMGIYVESNVWVLHDLVERDKNWEK